MKYKINASSELMKNQKHATVMSPGKAFQALQTQEGHTLFFSIGTDEEFYLTREIPGSKTGWERKDLTAELSKSLGGAEINVKTFRVAQNLQTNKIVLAMAVKGEMEDTVYTITGLDNTDQIWSGDFHWQAQPFDDEGEGVPDKLEVSDIYIAESNSEYIIIDIAKDPDASVKLVDRYYLDVSEGAEQVWKPHDLSGELESETIQSCLGRRQGKYIDGVYSLGSIGGERQLLYTPVENFTNPKVLPRPTRLVMPESAGAIASARYGSGYSGLFVTGKEGLYYFAPNNQKDSAEGQLVLRDPLFADAKTLHANVGHDKVVIWGLNEAGKIFYTQTREGSETNESSWSHPVPICTGVSQVSTYLNVKTSEKVIFAYTSGEDLIKLTQDPQNTMWNRRKILLPSTDVNDILEVNTYTTHVQVLREDNLAPKEQVEVSITSSSPVSVYIENKFVILSADTPYKITPDATGTLTILQETENLCAVSYTMQLPDQTDKFVVNPMEKMLGILEGVKSGEDLSKVTVSYTDPESGELKEKPLIPAEVSEDDRNASAQAIQQFIKASKKVPGDGSAQQRVQTRGLQTPTTTIHASKVSEDNFWGMSFGGEGVNYHAGQAAFQQFSTAPGGFSTRSISQSFDPGDAIVSVAGDVFNWAKDAMSEVKEFFVNVVDDVYHFYINIAGKVFTFVLDCLEAVARAIEFVFNKIKAFIEDLIDWIGFLFKWKDILRTQKVIKSFIKGYIGHVVANMDQVKSGVDSQIAGLKDKINDLTGLQSLEGNLSDQAKEKGRPAGSDDPQNNYGSYHMKNGLSDSPAKTSSGNDPGGELSDKFKKIMEDLKEFIDHEKETIEDACTRFEEQVANQIEQLSVGEIVKRTLGIIAGALLDSLKNVIDLTIDLAKLITEGIMSLLDTPIEIPVLSWLYEKITDDKLSFLSVTCLVVAIPSTLLYKVIKNEAPFPDNDTTDRLINANNWEGIMAEIAPKSAPKTRGMVAQTNPAGSNEASNGTENGSGLVVFLRILAGVSSGIFIIMNTVKKADMEALGNARKAGLGKIVDSPASKAISFIHGINFFCATLPNFIIGQMKAKEGDDFNPYLVLFYTVTSCQKIVDIFSYTEIYAGAGIKKGSNFIDVILGFATFIPVFASLRKDVTISKVISVIANVSWQSNRVLSPLSTMPRIFAAKQVLIGVYSVGELLAGATEGV